MHCHLNAAVIQCPSERLATFFSQLLLCQGERLRQGAWSFQRARKHQPRAAAHQPGAGKHLSRGHSHSRGAWCWQCASYFRAPSAIDSNLRVNIWFLSLKGRYLMCCFSQSVQYLWLGASGCTVIFTLYLFAGDSCSRTVVLDREKRLPRRVLIKRYL